MYKLLAGLALLTSIQLIPTQLVNTVSNFRVIDGDTIVDTTTNTKHRLACIDAPESKQPYGLESKEYLKFLVQQDIKTQTIGTDMYGRKLSLLYIDDQTTVQKLLVESGLVYVYHEYKNDCPIYNELANAEQSAQQKRINIWSGDYIKPWLYRKLHR